MSERYGLDVPSTGDINWHYLTETVNSIARTRHIPGELASQWKERLKSEATHVVLNTLTALHTLSLNGGRPIRDQIALSKCLKHLDRLLNKPPFPGVENAAAQLLMDWAFLYGGEDVGVKSFTILTSTSKHRAMLQGMQASDVAVMLREDQRIGMPQFIRVVRGVDFGRQFGPSQFGSPLTGAGAPQGVLNFLAKAAVAASYSGSSTAAAAAASRNTFAAWAERVQQDPQGAAYKVLSAEQLVQADTQALAAAQAACLAAARPFSNKPQQPQQQHGSSSGSRGRIDPYADLRRELDRAYLVACKCTEWREMIQVLLQNPLPDSQISALLTLADSVNATLEEWQAAATTEIFWLLGVDTAGLADGSILAKVLVEANLAPAAAAAESSAAGPQQQQQQRLNANARASYLDLLTGDSLPMNSSDMISNPFITNPAVETVVSGRISNPFLASSSSSSSSRPALAATAAAAAGTASAVLPPQLQTYIQEATRRPSPPAAAAAAPAAAAAVYPAMASRPFPEVVGGSRAAAAAANRASNLTGSSSSKYPDVPTPAVQPLLSLPLPQQQQQQQQQPGQLVGSSSSSSVTDRPMEAAGMQQQKVAASTSNSNLQQQQQQSDSSSWRNAADQVSLPAFTTTGSSSSSVIGSHPRNATDNSTQAAGPSSGTAGAAAGGTGSSTDSPSCSYNYINPFAALDTNNIISGLKLTSPRSSSDGAAIGNATNIAAAAAAAAAPGVSKAAAAAAAKQPIRSSSAGSVLATSTSLSPQQQQKWQQQQQQPLSLIKKREPPSPPSVSKPAAAAAAAETAMSGMRSSSSSSSTHNLQQQQVLANGSSPVPSQAAAAPLSPASRQRVLQLQQQQQQPYLSLQEIEQLQCRLHEVFDSCRNTNSSSSCCCQHCNMPPVVPLQSRLLQLLVQQEQQRRQQQQQQEQQHRQEVKRVKEMALEKLREMQQQLVQAQKQLAELQQQQQQQH